MASGIRPPWGPARVTRRTLLLGPHLLNKPHILGQRFQRRVVCDMVLCGHRQKHGMDTASNVRGAQGNAGIALPVISRKQALHKQMHYLGVGN